MLDERHRRPARQRRGGVERTPRPTPPSRDALQAVCAELARQIVADGEGVDRRRRDRRQRRRRRRAGEARSRGGSRPRRSSRPRSSAATRTGAACSPRPARRRSTAASPSSTPRASRSRSTASRSSWRRAARASSRTLDGADVLDRARPRARRRARQLPDERPLLRLRPDQRGLPDREPIVVKIGGAVAGRRGRRRCSSSHGPTRSASFTAPARRSPPRWSCAGLAVEFVGGRRVTTPAALDVVRRVARARSTRSSARRSAPRAVAAVRRRDRPRGRCTCRSSACVGDPLPCAPAAVVDALAAGLIPVVAPLAAGPLNVNADEAAAALAVGLGAERILFLTDVPGLLARRRGRRRDRGGRREQAARRRRASRAGSSRSCAPRSPRRGSASGRRSAQTAVARVKTTVARSVRPADLRAARRHLRLAARAAGSSTPPGSATSTSSRGIAVVGARTPPPRAARRRARPARPALARVEPLLDGADGAARRALSRPLRRRAGVLLQLGRRGGRGRAQVRAQGDGQDRPRRARGLVPRPHVRRALRHRPACRSAPRSSRCSPASASRRSNDSRSLAAAVSDLTGRDPARAGAGRGRCPSLVAPSSSRRPRELADDAGALLVLDEVQTASGAPARSSP